MKGSEQKSPTFCKRSGFGAGSRGRTDTVSLPLDFESSTSANSITPAYSIHTTDILSQKREIVKPFFEIFTPFFHFFEYRFPSLSKNPFANQNSRQREVKKHVTKRAALYRGRVGSRATDQGTLHAIRKSGSGSRAEESDLGDLSAPHRMLQPLLRSVESMKGE